MSAITDDERRLRRIRDYAQAQRDALAVAHKRLIAAVQERLAAKA